MSKRPQLVIALTGLLVAASLLAVLFIVIMAGEDYATTGLPQAVAPIRIQPPARSNPPPDPYWGRDDDALRRVWRRRAFSQETGDTSGRTLRQVVETEVFNRIFPNLFCSGRIEREGWRAFRLENSVYEVQFNYRDVGVEFGPAWVVQVDPDGLQPQGSAGVVPANLFARILQSGVSQEMQRFLNREAEVVQALTNHRFAQGAHLGSALLVYFKERQREVRNAALVGWTVVPERIVPGEATYYRAFFQWVEDGRPRFAQWEINLDTHQFRGLNLLASDIMATGDRIDTYQLPQIRPQNLEQAQRDNPRHARLFQAARQIVDDERLIEAIAALLWHQAQFGTTIEYPIPPTRWDSVAVPDQNRVYDVSYPFTADGEPERISFRVNLDSQGITPQDELATLVYTTLFHVRRPLEEIPGAVLPQVTSPIPPEPTTPPPSPPLPQIEPEVGTGITGSTPIQPPAGDEMAIPDQSAAPPVPAEEAPSIGTAPAVPGPQAAPAEPGPAPSAPAEGTESPELDE